MSTTTPIEREKQIKRDQALIVLINAIRQAHELAPASAPALCVSAYIAVYGFAGVSSVATALKSS